MKTKLTFILFFIVGWCYAQDSVKIKTEFALVLSDAYLQHPFLKDAIIKQQNIIKADSIKTWVIQNELNSCDTTLKSYVSLSNEYGNELNRYSKLLTTESKRKRFWRTFAGVFGVVSLTEFGVIYLRK